jgi:3-oxoadipate enol-lactonase
MKLLHRLDGPSSAPVLVLSGSLGTTHRMWDAQVPALLRRFRVLRHDHRGHGGSTVAAGPYAMEDLAGDLLELLDRNRIDRAAFCGLSLGAAVGITLASMAPERVERLVLCSASARFGSPEGWLDRARRVRADGLEAVADEIVARWFTPRFGVLRPETVGRFRAMLAATPAEGYAACCDALRAWDVRGRLGSVVAPTLVLAAEDDPAAPPAQGRELADGIAGARLVVIPHAAHLANVERPGAFTAAVLGHVLGEAV